MLLPLNVRIGFFLARRQIRRTSLWTTTLIVFVMVFTFLNLVVVSGILVGLLQGAINATRELYTSDVIVSAPADKEYIENSAALIELVRSLPQVESATPRFREAGVLEANYKTKKDNEKPNTAGGQVVGIDPIAENTVTGIGSHMVEGSFLKPGDFDQVVLGNYLLKQYLPIETPAFTTLEHVQTGRKIRLKVGGVMREVTVKGVLKTKVDELSLSVFMVDTQLKSMIGRGDGNVDEIAIKVKPGADPLALKRALILRGVNDYAKVQTYEDAQPQFLKDMIKTFGMLGTAFSSLGLAVAAITIFIVIFINALTRRKYIGILKGIGIHGRAIEYSYIFQSIFYAVCGSIIGLCLVYGALVPLFLAHPIDFPFSDGILVAPLASTLLRMALLIVSTIVAGYIPAWMIIRKNTLDSILGRA